MKDRTLFDSTALIAGFVYLSLATCNSATAQDAEEDIYELSPFVVEGLDDGTYRAQSTLAGTRIKSSLKDISASISVFTEAFLEDVGATNAQDVLKYSVNTENEDEYFSDDVGGNLTQSTTQSRVRGLTVAANSRNFFRTELRADTYNTEQITMVRGPNSVLYGIGSPSGAIDSSYKMAIFEDKLGVKLQADQRGSFRSTLDLNKKVNDKFAVRLIGLDQDQKTFIDPSYDDETRYFGTFTYQPFEKTAIRAYYESMNIDRVSARHTMPVDGISEWIDQGKPLYDNLNGNWVDLGGNVLDSQDFKFVTRDRRASYIFSNGNEVAPSETLPHGNQVQPATIMTSATPESVSSFVDESVIPSDRNIYGEGNQAKMDAEVMSVAIEQRIGKNFGVELAYNKEEWNYDGFEAIRAGLIDSRVLADVNLYLYDNAGNVTDVENPNVGRYYVESPAFGFSRYQNIETYRATASYQLNLSDKVSWLGNHNISGLYQNEEVDGANVVQRVKSIVGSDVDPGFGWSDANQDVYNRAYLDLGGSLSDGSGQYTVPEWVSPVENGLSYWPVSYGSNHEAPTHQITKTESTMAAIQSFFDLSGNENDQLVVTYGVRRDALDSKGIDSSSAWRDENGIFQWEDLPVDQSLIDISGETSSLGIVYHTPVRGLSLLYSKSNNFNPQVGFRDYEGNSHPASEGKTVEYGVGFESRDGKFFARLVNFETKTVNQVEGDWFFYAPNWYVISQMESMVDEWVDIYAARGIDRSGDLAPLSEDNKYWYWDVGDMRPINDRTSKGYEFEMYYSPTPNLNLRLSAAKTEATHSSIAHGLIDYIDGRWDVWEQYKDLTIPSYISSSSDPDVQSGLYDNAFAYSQYVWDPQPELLSNYYSVAYGPWWVPIYTNEEALPRIEEIKAMEGRATQRSRKWRVNVSANYDFKDGRLKNLGIGGAVRYRSPMAIGNYGIESDNPALPSGILVADLDRPIFGDDVLEFDVWMSYWKIFKMGERDVAWSLALNVQNLFSDGGVSPSTADFDGSYSRMMIDAPREVFLTTGFDF